jgi:phosphonate transport system substrate-binding protein
MIRKTTKTKIRLLLAIVFIFSTLLTIQSAAAVEKPLFLYLAYSDTGLSYPEFFSSAQQLGQMLEEKIGRKVVAIVPHGDPKWSNDHVIRALRQGRADISGLARFAYLVAHDTANAELVVNSTLFGQVAYHAQIMTHNQTGYSDLSALNGVDICWGESISVSSYIVPSIMLKAAGVTPGTGSQFVGIHSTVVEMIYTRNCDAGASYADARNSLVGQYPDVFEVVQVIGVSPLIPNYSGFSVAEGTPMGLKSAITTALLEIAQDETGVVLLGKLGYQDIVQADHSIFVGLEELISNAGMTPQEVWDTYFFRETTPN